MRAAMTRALLLVLSILAASCGSQPKTAPEDATNASARRADPEEGPPTDPNADPLFTAATRICRLVDHKDEGVLAVAFVPEFFDTTSPAKLDAALFEVRGALGRCGEHMVVVERASPLEGTVAVECEHGVLLLSIGLATTSHHPMMTLGTELRPQTSLRDVRKPTAPKSP
jgi:hypothetical protein